MPTPKAGESQQSWMSRCIPQVKADKTAKDQKQAVAICLSMWKKRSEDEEMAGDNDFYYDEEAREATLILSNGRQFKLSNVTKERAEAFVKRYRAEAAAMAARGMPGDPLSFQGPAGTVVR